MAARGSCDRWLLAPVLVLHVVLGFQTVKDPSSSCTFNGTVGGSVQLPLNLSLRSSIREIEWKWHFENEKEQLLVAWKPGIPNQWYNLEDKYKHKFNLTEMAFLSIVNLTMEMSRRYEATIKFHSGQTEKQLSRLCVYEPTPQPHILIHSSSYASGWCNVSVECEVPGATEHLSVTWVSQGLPTDPEKRGTLVRGDPSSRNLSLNLLRSQSNGSLTCVVSNSVDQKNTTLDLGTICSWRGSLQRKGLWIALLAVIVIASLGAGMWIWKRKRMGTKREKVLGRPGAAPQALPTEESADLHTGELSTLYSEISPVRRSKNNTEEDGNPAKNPKPTLAAHTINKKI